MSESRGSEYGGLGPISRREFEVLDMLGRGYRAKNVARQLAISYETVRTHQKNIYRKFGVNSLIQALMVYQREIQTAGHDQQGGMH